MRNYLTIAGKDSKDFGVYISGHGTFSAPEKAYQFYEIPGRNGAILGNDHRLENIEVSYECFIYTNFSQNIADFRSFLLSLDGYQILTDTYHPDEYRMAVFTGPFEPKVTQMNNAGSFTITFNCKPQRYLFSGLEKHYFVQGNNIIISGNDSINVYGPKLDQTYLVESVNYPSGVPLQFGFKIDGTTVYLENRTQDAYLGYTPTVVDYNFISGVASVYGEWKQIPRAMYWSVYPDVNPIFQMSTGGAYTVLDTNLFAFVNTGTLQEWLSSVALEYNESIYFDEANDMLYAYSDQCSDLQDFDNFIMTHGYPKMRIDLVTPDTFQITPYTAGFPNGFFTLAAYKTITPTYDTMKVRYTGVSDIMTNPTVFPSDPLIRIYGVGSFEMDGVTVTVSTCGTYTDVDCELMDCYEGTTNRNNAVSFSTYDFPKLQPGNNQVTITTGVTIVEMTPRWWRV